MAEDKNDLTEHVEEPVDIEDEKSEEPVDIEDEKSVRGTGRH